MKTETNLKKLTNYNSTQIDRNYQTIQHDSILFRNVDIHMDIFNTNPEKNLKRLPSNLRFIKKYLYLDLLPKIDKLIDELEKIKKTSNYDEKIILIKPNLFNKLPPISCSNLFENHNIKHMKSNKIICGTFTGNILIYDFEINKLLIEKTLGHKGRVEIIETSTIKFFDSLISRCAINIRGDPNITLLSYNHSYNTFNNECVINLKDNNANFTQDPNSIHLNTIPLSIKFSKDTFIMTVTDYCGGIRVYKFNDIPQSPAIQDLRTVKKETPVNPMGIAFMSNRKTASMKNSVSESITGQLKNNDGDNIAQANDNSNSVTATLIGYYKQNEEENYTILALNNKNNQNFDNNNDNKKKDDKKKDEKSNKIEPPKKDIKKKDEKRNEQKSEIQPIQEEGCYNEKPFIDEDTNLDMTPCLKFPKNKPEIIFLQKKLIIEEKINGGFSTCCSTIGFYIAFYGTHEFKYISLYSYLTNNMKNVFKISKSKGLPPISQEESMSISSSVNKREKEYMKFIKSKLDPLVNTINIGNNLSFINNGSIVGHGQLSTNNNYNNNQNKTDKNNIINPIYVENTRNELNFNTLVKISCICGQGTNNNKNNYIAIGMIDGSVLIWDTELQCDKYLFQDNKNEITSLTIDSNYLLTTAKDGKVYTYELTKGEKVIDCYHNPYKNYPVFYVKEKKL
jgi:hypothetical protein